MIDWYDKNACHHGDVDGHDRTNGRIFKISYGPSKPAGDFPPRIRPAADLAQPRDLTSSTMQLAAADAQCQRLSRPPRAAAAARAGRQTHVRSRRPSDAPADCAEASGRDPAACRRVGSCMRSGPLDVAIAGLRCSAMPARYVRAWTIQLAGDMAPGRRRTRRTEPPGATCRERSVAGRCGSIWRPRLQRLPLADAGNLAALVAACRGQTIRICPAWTGMLLEPLVARRHAAGLGTGPTAARSPNLLRNAVRRAAAIGDEQAIETIVRPWGHRPTAERQLVVLLDLAASLCRPAADRRAKSWPATYAALLASSDPNVRGQLEALAVTFGDASALTALRARLADAKLDPQQRVGAWLALVKAKDSQLAGLLRSLLGDAALRGPALRALATSEDPETAAAILAVYSAAAGRAPRRAGHAAAPGSPYAKALLAAVADKRVAATDSSADLVTQLKALGNPEVTAALERVWGSVRELQADRAKLVEQYKSQLATPSNPPADINLGRAMFAKTCQQCHTLFGVGGKVGPELTGANRSDVGYLLSNILDPGAAVLAKEYTSSILVLDDGRVITGIVKAQDANTIAVQTQNELLTLARGDVDTVKPSDKSMMPEDLPKPLTEREIAACCRIWPVRSKCRCWPRPTTPPGCSTART